MGSVDAVVRSRCEPHHDGFAGLRFGVGDGGESEHALGFADLESDRADRRRCRQTRVVDARRGGAADGIGDLQGPRCGPGALEGKVHYLAGVLVDRQRRGDADLRQVSLPRRQADRSRAGGRDLVGIGPEERADGYETGEAQSGQNPGNGQDGVDQGCGSERRVLRGRCEVRSHGRIIASWAGGLSPNPNLA